MSKIKDTPLREGQTELQRTIWTRYVDRVLKTYEETSNDLAHTTKLLRTDVGAIQQILDRYKK